MDPEFIKAVVDAFEASSWGEMTVTVGADRLHVSRQDQLDRPADDLGGADGAVATGSSATAPLLLAPGAAAGDARQSPRQLESAPQPEAPEQPESPRPLSGTVVEAPSMGLFWRAPAPGAAPFVEVGAAVSAGDTLAIVEVMKLMNHIVSPVAGTVTAILAKNGETVAKGHRLFVLDGKA